MCLNTMYNQISTIMSVTKLVVAVTFACATGILESQWKNDNALQNKVFHNPTSATYQKSVLACVVGCLETVTGCYLVTYNGVDGSCRAHSYGVNTAIYTPTPHTSVRARDINEVLAGLCTPYTFISMSDKHICFDVVRILKTYSDADDFCRDRGGHLVVLDTLDKSLALKTGYAWNPSLEVFWIGLDETAEEGNWIWVNGSPLTFENWYSSEPNDYGVDEDCTTVYSTSFQWHDYPCTNEQMFICEKDL